jgi:TIR domain-containing protein
MADILLSYKSEELATAEALALQLREAGLLIGLAERPSDQAPTANEIDANEKEIDGAECVVVLWSRSSPPYVLMEAQRAASQHKLVIADLQNVALPAPLAGQPVIDISSWLVTRNAAELEPLEITINSIAEKVRKAAQALLPDIYLAYRRINEVEAEAVLNTLEGAGYNVWWDRKIAPGTYWEREITRAFLGAKLIVLIATREALKAKAILLYLRKAAEEGAALLIAEFDSIAPNEYPLGLGREQRLGLWDWRTTHDPSELQRVLRAVQGIIGQPSQRKVSEPSPPPARKNGAPPRAGHDVFVSYKREDRARIAPYVKRLVESGLQVWWDTLIQTGANWGFTLERALRASRSVAVFWTPLSATSEEVYTEADYGMRIHALFPLLLEPCEIPERMKRIQYFDLTSRTSDKRFDDLILEIKYRIGAE